jgi:putative Mn2+ efflux pump MntP
MNPFTLLVVAVGLGMDACAVSIAGGFNLKPVRPLHALKIATFFGVFQAGMPCLGWLAGLSFRKYIEAVDHWIAFGLLVLIGARMIYESFRLEAETEKIDPTRLKILLVLSIATSVDALAVGISFSILESGILLPMLVIGCVTWVMSFAGVYIGQRFGHLLESRVELAGGFILIGIGIKILVEHLA